MSWFQKNYEKAALGGAVAVALGLAYMGWSKFGSVEEDFSTELTGSGNSNTAVRNADQVTQTKASLGRPRVAAQGVVDGDRPVDLFTGIALFVSSATPEKPIDLLEKGGAPVHPPIPNIWWIEHRIDPGFADSPARDPDQDGFSNLEEFTAKTDPNDTKSVPSLIAKLMYVKDESLGWVIRPSFGMDGSFPFKYQDTKGGVNQTPGAEPVAPGGLFFARPPMKERFKLLGSEVRREMDPKVKMEKDNTYVRIEDQRPNKKGTVYEIPSPLSEERRNEHLKWDRTAVLSLEALGLSGKEFKVEENTAFALPPDSPKKDYLLKSVTPEDVEVEYTNPAGEKKSVRISKGSMPQIAD
jgi:hypothetical protein